MKVIVFGATGMVGQGVVRECLLDPGQIHVPPGLHPAAARHSFGHALDSRRLRGADAVRAAAEGADAFGDDLDRGDRAAMLAVARKGAPKAVLETADIEAVAASA
jgi:uncharacterized protein YbjT (DUF2867 family)